MKKRVFSGVQPTGNVHVGNYIGAFQNWVRMQDTYETIYCVVDLHAMTVPYEPADFMRQRLDMAKMIVASGVDPHRSLLYFQSDVPQHAELAWILSTITGIGQLERMTQYKEKSDRAGQNLGLLSYPVLMAADIVIHKVHAVPVGDDQTQHLELTRDLVERFNSRFGDEFPLPERITPEIGARVMSLQDPTSKMSKSDPSPASRILLTDSDDDIRKKIKSAVTDSDRYVRYDWDEKPGVSNLLELFSVFSGRPISDLVGEYEDAGYGAFKAAAAEAVVSGVAPIRDRFESIGDDEILAIMDQGAATARERAEAEMTSVRRKVGLSA
ncbi:MAG: tryptophan--tRNA ligase [Acidimicrobiia bacterium]|nr:tryptophan--tRNA ligase [Acidimicrobiia bacterium]MDH4307075.1 tryptophan--tRNA ligase [Acidimicrobiia bacterium]